MKNNFKKFIKKFNTNENLEYNLNHHLYEKIIDLKFNFDEKLKDYLCIKFTDLNTFYYDTKNKNIKFNKNKFLEELKKCKKYTPLFIFLKTPSYNHVVGILFDSKKKIATLIDNENNKSIYDFSKKVIKKLNINYKIKIPSIKISKNDNKLGKCDLCVSATFLIFYIMIVYQTKIEDIFKYLNTFSQKQVFNINTNFFKSLEN